MDYAEFIKNVKSRAGIANDAEAERACCATLLTIIEHLPEKNAEGFQDELPDELSECLRNAIYGQQYGIKEFYSRVSEREKVDPETAVGHARAVFDVLTGVISEHELEDLRFEFAPDYEDLFGVPMHETGKK